MNTAQIRTTIQSLNRINVEKASYSYITTEMKKILHNITIQTLENSFLNNSFFRARIFNSEKLTKLNDIGAPPSHLIKNFQRCNPPQTAMFYAASKKISAILEIKPQKNDIVYLCEWVDLHKSRINTIFSYQFTRNNFATSAIEDLVYTYFDTKFTNNIHPQDSAKYKITSAIAQLLTTNFESNKINGRNTSGLIYPSIVNIEDSYNIAYHAQEAIEIFQPINIVMIKILNISEHAVEFELIDNSINFTNNTINWNNNSDYIYLTKTKFTSKERKFIFKNGKWNLHVEYEFLRTPSCKYHLEN